MDLNYIIVNETGMKRTNNEDAVLFIKPKKPWIKQAMGYLAIIADGMGGHAKGEKASKLAIEIISSEYYSKVDQPENALMKACLLANNTISKEGKLINQSIGTTCTTVAITPKSLHFLHIGDSRAYLFENKKLTQVTEDHTLANKTKNLEIGNNILTRSLGAEFQNTCPGEIFKIEKSLLKGDRILLCTDGLYSYISHQEMESTLSEMPLEELGGQWVKWVLNRGASDNFSFIILEVKSP